jgi:hypothetical protein
MHDDVVYYLDNRSPAIRRAIDDAWGSLDINTISARIKVRPEWSDEVVIDAPMTKDLETQEFVYNPPAGAFSQEGIYRAWIAVDLGSSRKQDTVEFKISVFAHAPGEGVRVGAIWRAARALAPVAWDALRGYTDYGDPELQRVIELAKLRTLPTMVSAANEASLDPRVVDYIAKRVLADNVLEAAISYWTNVIVSISASANSAEVKSYPDRIRATQDQLERLRAQIAIQKDEVDAIVGVTTGVIMAGPQLLNGGDPLTPALEDVPGLCEPVPAYSPGWFW